MRLFKACNQGNVEKGHLVFGPLFSGPDSFFLGLINYKNFDAFWRLINDQGLIRL